MESWPLRQTALWLLYAGSSNAVTRSRSFVYSASSKSPAVDGVIMVYNVSDFLHQGSPDPVA